MVAVGMCVDGVRSADVGWWLIPVSIASGVLLLYFLLLVLLWRATGDNPTR
jgi:hypothetical protein